MYEGRSLKIPAFLSTNSLRPAVFFSTYIKQKLSQRARAFCLMETEKDLPDQLTERESEHPAVLTPMMKQYMAIKAANPETVLLYRMGDFYETFNEDAKIASKVLGITLTSRNHGGADKTPLAGFPYHALDRYAHRLVKAGYRIAVCEQTEDPKTAKGLVKRDIVETVTAGTATEDAFLDERSNNYIAAIYKSETLAGIAVCDLTTGEFTVEEVAASAIEEELARTEPLEVLLSEEADDKLIALVKETLRGVFVSYSVSSKFIPALAEKTITDHFDLASIEGLGLSGFTCGLSAAGALLSYLKTQKRNELKHISGIKPKRLSEFAELDPATIRGLELLRPMQTGETEGTLLSAIDRTATAMGARLLRRWLTRPLKEKIAINERLDCVDWLKADTFARSELSLILRSIADIERLIGKVTFERANARDIVALAKSLDVFPSISKTISVSTVGRIRDLSSALGGFAELASEITNLIVDEPPLAIREGGIIRPGISAELDETRDASINGKQWIADMQAKERERTGISTLKVGYNRVFGYYIEITNANSASVPDNYIRKQTLANAERYLTPELKEMEGRILGAEEKLTVMEYEMFVELRKRVAVHCGRIQRAAEAIAELDVFSGLARVAAEWRYCRPILTDGIGMAIADGRHPVVEQMNPAEQFVPNDTLFEDGARQITLVTGPNMAGKSTYLRQTAIISILAQMGSFVPAASAEIGIVDRFFTRVGASDRLARGQSTFLVEMIEVANILNNASDRSLVILDEVGRGTSTFDGISIAWAVCEYLHETAGRRARTLFATHYHELTELSLLFPRIRNCHISVKEWNDKIIFLRKIVEGGSDHSYGIQVARLAGVPLAVISRAKEILGNLENMEFTPEHKPVLARHREAKPEAIQQDLFNGIQLNMMDAHKVELISQIQNLDVDGMSPRDALAVLYELKKKAADTR